MGAARKISCTRSQLSPDMIDRFEELAQNGGGAISSCPVWRRAAAFALLHSSFSKQCYENHIQEPTTRFIQVQAR